MSTYPYWSLRFPMRADRAVEHAALAAVASGRAPEPDVLAALHPVVRYYLADATRFLAFEDGPRVGSPVRLARDPFGSPQLSIEFCFHDDEFAGGGWLFWLWVLSLVQPPTRVPYRGVIGCHGLYPSDYELGLVTLTAEGVSERPGRVLTWAEMEEPLADRAPWEDYAG